MIVVNGERSALAPGSTVRDLLAELSIDERGIAVAVDAEVIHRGEWDTFQIGDNTRVEVLTAVQGG